jgi:hypothetical protein
MSKKQISLPENKRFEAKIVGVKPISLLLQVTGLTPTTNRPDTDYQ